MILKTENRSHNIWMPLVAGGDMSNKPSPHHVGRWNCFKFIFFILKLVLHFFLEWRWNMKSFQLCIPPCRVCSPRPWSSQRSRRGSRWSQSRTSSPDPECWSARWTVWRLQRERRTVLACLELRHDWWKKEPINCLAVMSRLTSVYHLQVAVQMLQSFNDL